MSENVFVTVSLYAFWVQLIYFNHGRFVRGSCPVIDIKINSCVCLTILSLTIILRIIEKMFIVRSIFNKISNLLEIVSILMMGGNQYDFEAL